jgi:hypothetical protein
VAVVEVPITMVNIDAMDGQRIGVPWILTVENRRVFTTGRTVVAAEIVDDEHVRLWLRDGDGKRSA